MPDRLNELVRQRALVLEHLAWLDREIARANSSPAPGPMAIPDPFAPSSSSSPAPTVPAGPAPAAGAADPGRSTPSSSAAATPGDAPVVLTEEILDQYRVSPTAV